MAILSISAAQILHAGFSSYFTGQKFVDADWQGRVALSRMTRDLHALRATPDITNATANAITFTDIDGNEITYNVSNSQLMRNTEPLAQYVQTLSFQYYDSNGTELTVFPINTDSIRYITITLTIHHNSTFHFMTGVTLWNIL